ncbi:MAG: hypothetical protein WCG42_03405 [Parachlamydiaceae bacterium]
MPNLISGPKNDASIPLFDESQSKMKEKPKKNSLVTLFHKNRDDSPDFIPFSRVSRFEKIRNYLELRKNLKQLSPKGQSIWSRLFQKIFGTSHKKLIDSKDDSEGTDL